ncbi:MAG: zinc-ribbon domain-containing protein [Caldilineaceae bacterium]
MMWIAVLIALVLSVGALAFVVWPLLKPGPAPVMVEDDRLTELLGRKDAVLKAIKDLEFDYQVGKLSEEDFQLYDQRLRRQAVALLQQIEEVAPQSADMDAAMEAEIAQRRRVLDPARAAVKPAAAVAASATVPVAASAPVAAAVPAAAPALAVAAAAPIGNGTVSGGAPRFCTNCGSRLEAHHKFCANCGTPATG